MWDKYGNRLGNVGLVRAILLNSYETLSSLNLVSSSVNKRDACQTFIIYHVKI